MSHADAHRPRAQDAGVAAVGYAARVLPLQQRKSGDIAIGRAQDQSVFDGERRQKRDRE